MSAGKSFHSVSGRWFWNDLPEATLAEGLTGPWAAAAAEMGGRLMTAAVVPDISAREEDDGGGAEDEAKEEGRALRTEAPTGLETSQAESGRSLR